MPAETVLLISPSSDLADSLRKLLRHMAPPIRLIHVLSFGEAEAVLSKHSVILAALHAESRGGSTPQAIVRLKRMLKHPIPILVLVCADMAEKVRALLRAGADEFWLLPLDSVAFPPRLQVLMEWGRSALEEGSAREAGAQPRYLKQFSPWTRFWAWIRHLFKAPNERASMAIELSTVFAGRWEKIRRLGFGSFGEVWLVKRKGEDRLAVAKIPHNTRLNPQFFREAAILKRLSGHPNAVRLWEVLEEDRKAVIIEEYVDGPTLQELLDEGLESATREKAYLELLDFLAFAHRHNIMHRDIKPENIIITPSGLAKLLDFGAAKDLTRRSTSSTVIGSRPYMAPEQISGKSRLGSDIWAMGILLYTLATGLLPFYDENEKNLMDMILECEPEAPRSLEPSLPERLEEIILKCLQKDPERRFKNAGELKDAIIEGFPQFGDGSTLSS